MRLRIIDPFTLAAVVWLAVYAGFSTRAAAKATHNRVAEYYAAHQFIDGHWKVRP